MLGTKSLREDVAFADASREIGERSKITRDCEVPERTRRVIRRKRSVREAVAIDWQRKEICRHPAADEGDAARRGGRPAGGLVAHGQLLGRASQLKRRGHDALAIEIHAHRSNGCKHQRLPNPSGRTGKRKCSALTK